MTVLILGSDEDEHASHVLHSIEARGHNAEFLDSRDFPQRLQLSLRPNGQSEILLPSGRPLSFAEIQSVYWRNFHGVNCPELPHEEQQFIAANDARSLFDSLLLELPCRWVNSWQGYQMHQRKPVALSRIAQLGIPTPATLWTNHAEEFKAFVANHDNCIVKPIQGGAHTESITTNELSDEQLERLSIAPITIQEKVDGVDVRVFVIGREVFACEVRSNSLDFRDDPTAEIVACDLPPLIRQRSQTIAHTLHLELAGIDFRRTPEGEYIFFEANPSPMFIGFESRTSLPLTEALIDLLLE